ncbi:MAG: hypothetical protein AB1832_01145 [Pseudomonadota bacterium]
MSMEWWNSVNSMAAVISCVCSVIAAGVSVAVFVKARSGDFAKKIESGDREQRKHTDNIARRIERDLSEQGDRIGEIEETVARIAQQQQHNLTARDLGPMHEKINRVAEQVAATTAETKGVREQLAVIHSLLLEKRL